MRRRTEGEGRPLVSLKNERARRVQTRSARPLLHLFDIVRRKRAHLHPKAIEVHNSNRAVPLLHSLDWIEKELRVNPPLINSRTEATKEDIDRLTELHNSIRSVISGKRSAQPKSERPRRRKPRSTGELCENERRPSRRDLVSSRLSSSSICAATEARVKDRYITHGYTSPEHSSSWDR